MDSLNVTLTVQVRRYLKITANTIEIISRVMRKCSSLQSGNSKSKEQDITSHHWEVAPDTKEGNDECWGHTKKQIPSSLLMALLFGLSFIEIIMESFQKNLNKTELLDDRVIPLLYNYPKNTKTLIKKIHTLQCQLQKPRFGNQPSTKQQLSG